MRIIFLFFFIFPFSASSNFDLQKAKQCFELTQTSNPRVDPVFFISSIEENFESIGAVQQRHTDALVFRETSGDQIRVHVIQDLNHQLPGHDRGSLSSQASKMFSRTFLGNRLGYRQQNIRQTFTIPSNNAWPCYNHHNPGHLQMGGYCQSSSGSACQIYPVSLRLSSAGGFCPFEAQAYAEGHSGVSRSTDITHTETSQILGRALVARLGHLIERMNSGDLRVEKEKLNQAFLSPGPCLQMVNPFPEEATPMIANLLCHSQAPRPNFCRQGVPVETPYPGVERFNLESIEAIPATYPVNR